MFILIWLAGDLCNLLGAVLAGLIPTVIILACYVSSSRSSSITPQHLSMDLKYSVCDSMLICQILYYRWKHHQPLFKSQFIEDSEREPLLFGTEGRKKHLSTRTLIIRYAAAFVFICAAGMTAWCIAGDNHGQDPESMPKQDWWKSQILGWASAFLFVCGFHSVVKLISSLL